MRWDETGVRRAVHVLRLSASEVVVDGKIVLVETSTTACAVRGRHDLMHTCTYAWVVTWPSSRRSSSTVVQLTIALVSTFLDPLGHASDWMLAPRRVRPRQCTVQAIDGSQIWTQKRWIGSGVHWTLQCLQDRGAWAMSHLRHCCCMQCSNSEIHPA